MNQEFFMKFKRYLPLFVLIAVAMLGSYAISWNRSLGLMIWLQIFMGFLFCQFSMLKLFNPSQFADGFQMYDLIAKKSRGYAYFYPFIELGLGVVYLAGIWLLAANIITIGLMGIGAFGVFRALQKGLDVRCACMGSILDVPLSTVTLTEDIGMGIMALLMLIFSV